jgi:magnesium transporter
MAKKKIVYADDRVESVGFLIRLRLPWLFAGLIIGAMMTVFVSRFENILSSHLQLAFFIPFIVYISDAVGAQTEIIYVRNLKRGASNLTTYVIKELLFGIITGLLFGVLVGIFAYIWLHSASVALTVGLSMAASISTATMLALVVPAILQRERTDPALGTAPLTTVIQDTISLMIYFFIASAIIF